MSAIIRRSLTLFLNRLIGYRTRTQPILDAAANNQEPNAGDIAELRACRIYIQEVLPKIEAKEAEWGVMIAALPDAPPNADGLSPRDLETRVYDNYNAAGIHFTAFVDESREKVTDIDILLGRIDGNRTRTPSSRSGGSSRASSVRQPARDVQAQIEAALIRGAVGGAAAQNAQVVQVVEAAAGRGGRAPNGSRLPKHRPPEFSGDPLCWQSFWQNFEPAVNRQNIDDCEKLSYLLESLKGKAARAVKGYEVTNENYPVVVEVLRKRFGQPEVIIEALEAELGNLPRAGESIESLRDTAEAVDRICRQITQLGTDENQLMFQVKAKIPTSVMEKLIDQEKAWKRLPENVGSKWSMKDFRMALLDHIETGEEARRHKESQKSSTKPVDEEREQAPRHERIRNRNRHATAFAVVANPESNRNQNGDYRRPDNRPTFPAGPRKAPRPCLFCDGIHWMADCDKVVHHEDRAKKLTELDRCFKCIRPGHRARDCTRQRKCRICTGDHNQILCPSPDRTAPKGNGPRTNGNGARFGENSKQVTLAAASDRSDDRAYLMTLKTKMARKDTTGLVFFDAGANVPLVKHAFAEAIGAKKLGREKLSVYHTGSRYPMLLDTIKYLIQMSGPDGESEEVIAYAKEHLPLLTSIAGEGTSWNPDDEIKASQVEPDILIGIHSFWRFFKKKNEVSPDAFVIETTLGDVLCGKWQVDSWTGSHDHTVAGCCTITGPRKVLVWDAEQQRMVNVRIDRLQEGMPVEVVGETSHYQSSERVNTREPRSHSRRAEVFFLGDGGPVTVPQKPVRTPPDAGLMMTLTAGPMSIDAGHPMPPATSRPVPSAVGRAEPWALIMCLTLIVPAVAGCKLRCLTEGVQVDIAEPGQMFLCCEMTGCQYQSNLSSLMHELPRAAMKGGYTCNAVCKLPSGQLPPVEIHCEEPNPANVWALWTGVTGAVLILLLLFGLLGWKLRKKMPCRKKARREPTIPQRTAGMSRTQGDPTGRPSPRPIFSIARSVITLSMIAMLATETRATTIGNMCSGCSVSCTQGGVAGTITADVIKSEVCCHGDYCHVPEPGLHWEHKLPDELVVNEYTCVGQIWGPNQARFNYTIECPPIDECLLITCRYCVDVIANPECYPVWTLIIYGTWVVGLLTVLCCCLTIFRGLRKNCRCLIRTSWWWITQTCRFLGCCCTRRQITPWEAELPGTSRIRNYWSLEKLGYRDSTDEQAPLTKQDPTPKRWFRHATSRGKSTLSYLPIHIAIVVGLGLFVAYSQADDAVMSTARTENCHREGGKRWCEWNHVTTMTLLPAGQPVTLLMKDPGNRILGTLQLTMNTLTTVCVPRTEQWTWAYQIHTQAVKRCPGRGLCDFGRCARVNNDDLIPDLDECNRFPSNQFCSESCSVWWCGCPVPPIWSEHLTACLFYCTYAKPTDSKTYEVFSCPTWEHHIEATIQFETDQDNRTHEAVLHPGMTYRMENLTITPLAISLAPAPIMSERFLSDGEGVALAGDASIDLHCDTKEGAESRNCTLAPSSCTHCEPDPDAAEVNCQCRNSDLAATMEDPLQRLPLTLSKLQLRSEGRKVFTETSHAPVQLLIKLENFRLAMETAETRCHVTPISLHGCYSCTTGGELRFNCRTEGESALATITCDDGTVFAHRCSDSEEVHAVTLAFSHADVHTRCKVACPAGETEFEMRGELRYIPQRRQGRFQTFRSNATGETRWFDLDLGFDFTNLLWKLLDWRVVLAVLTVTILAIAVTLLVIRCNPALRGYQMLARAVMVTSIIFFVLGGLPAEAAHVNRGQAANTRHTSELTLTTPQEANMQHQVQQNIINEDPGTLTTMDETGPSTNETDSDHNETESEHNSVRQTQGEATAEQNQEDGRCALKRPRPNDGVRMSTTPNQARLNNDGQTFAAKRPNDDDDEWSFPNEQQDGEIFGATFESPPIDDDGGKIGATFMMRTVFTSGRKEHDESLAEQQAMLELNQFHFDKIWPDRIGFFPPTLNFSQLKMVRRLRRIFEPGSQTGRRGGRFRVPPDGWPHGGEPGTRAEGPINRPEMRGRPRGRPPGRGRRGRARGNRGVQRGRPGLAIRGAPRAQPGGNGREPGDLARDGQAGPSRDQSTQTSESSFGGSVANQEVDDQEITWLGDEPETEERQGGPSVSEPKN